MPTFKEKVAEFLRQLSSGNDQAKLDLKSPCTSPTTGTFIHKYLCGEVKRDQPDIQFGKSCYDLPVREIGRLSSRIICAYTGPAGGLTKVNRGPKAFEYSEADVDFIDDDYLVSCENINKDSDLNSEINRNREGEPSVSWLMQDAFPEESEEVAGVKNWNRPRPFAYGIATTLYELHPFTQQNAGEPIADSFGICVRENSSILALADGVNWGEKSCLAARCAVNGCMDYLNKALYREGGTVDTTLDIFVCLLRSFHAAHNLILQEHGLLTTLCAAVICQLDSSDHFIVCTCNVGDSLAYVYSKKHGVREITQGSHDINSMRDMRDALGALGPVDGQNPELNNLTVAMTVVEVGDIVFLTSDGISDNFDPVVGKFAMPKKIDKSRENDNSARGGANSNGVKDSSSNIEPPPPLNPFMPVVEAHQRHELTLLRMEDLLQNGVNEGDASCETAQQLCDHLIDFATKLTVAKRRILEDPDLYKDGDNQAVSEQRMRRRKVGEKLAMVPGKLDHASVVAYQVTRFDKAAKKNKGHKGVPLTKKKEASKASSRPTSSSSHFESSI